VTNLFEIKVKSRFLTHIL